MGFNLNATIRVQPTIKYCSLVEMDITGTDQTAPMVILADRGISLDINLFWDKRFFPGTEISIYI